LSAAILGKFAEHLPDSNLSKYILAYKTYDMEHIDDPEMIEYLAAHPDDIGIFAVPNSKNLLGKDM
jgi:hypothetical protein